ncbi:uncharacterized protein Ecym_8425 [Eremothecium cymbalariae DBVPG|uniref:Laccase n=1 Tax=Eremothecium cymbalariae (strain CBS 270.75 / DBVPG 7215 / KCTC 17166 / NRRL Y-17582) TaxID=931890 RepID=G8JXX0_ERECY|nr:Hypothetical protein Ecym_8425 [Eremothecium cymbalariae DBVPG\
MHYGKYFPIIGSEGEEDRDESAQCEIESGNRCKQRPQWFVLLQYTLCVCIPLLILAFTIRDIKLLAKIRGAERPWRLDTSKNYTMDTRYWREQGDVPQERHYYFNISKLVEKAPDGIVRNLTVINGQYPGPLIEANAGDVLWIHVQNWMEDEAVTIHCHGLFFNQRDGFNDGAAHINQCPIPGNGGRYNYRIRIDEDQWGTYWYHSHFSTQAADGVFGPLVIHSRKEDRLLSEAYDEDVVVLVNDYYHDVASSYLDEYMAPGNENEEPTPDNGLIQGSNKFVFDSATYMVPHANSEGSVGSSDTGDRYVGAGVADLAVVKFKPGVKYRVRVVNAGFFGSFNFAVDNHLLRVIEADGTNVEPVDMHSLDMSVGQRYSFILQRQENTIDRFWMHARFNRFCFADDSPNFDKDVKAVVSYGNSTAEQGEVLSTSWPYGGGDVICRDSDQSLFATLNGKVPLREDGSRKPDVSVNLDVAFLIKERQLSRGYFNEMTYRHLEQSCSMHELAFSANDNGIRNLRTEPQLETKNKNQYLLNFDKRGTVVDLIVNNFDDGAHPFHIHGHKFWVLKVGEKGYFDDTFYEDDSDAMNFENPILRDTVNVNGYGYAVLRFVINNPGVWPFHCHIGWHMEAGLLLQINALQNEYSNWQYPSLWAEHCHHHK